MAQIETLEQDIYNVLKNGAEITPQIRASFSNMCNRLLERALSKPTVASQPYLRMSNIGKKPRQLWYEIKGYKGEELSGNTYLKFLYGDIIEALVITLAKAAGHDVQNEQALVGVDGVKGSIDCTIDGNLVDVKSCSSYSFNNKFKETADMGVDEFGYYGQAAGYSAGMGLPFHGWLAVDKQNGHVRVSKADQSHIPDASTLIAEKRAVLDLDEPPQRCYPDVPFQKSGNMQLDIGCSYCKFKQECWNDANDGKGLRMFVYANKPVFMTKVEREPNVQEVLL